MSRTNTGSVHGLTIRGSIQGYDESTGEILVALPLKQSDRLNRVKLPASWVGPKGQLTAGYPQKGTPIFVVQGQGNEWVFVGYDRPDTTTSYDNDGLRTIDPSLKLKPGRWVSLIENDIGIIQDPHDGIYHGDSIQFTQEDPQRGIKSSRFLQDMSFSDSHRSVAGPLKRDISSNNSRDVSGSSLTGHTYDDSLTTIGLDPRTATSISTSGTRNPSLTESRSMYYEFSNSFGYTNDRDESRLYDGEDSPSTKPYQRKRSRTDTMSLSLDHPNFLAETIVGTIVDIYGNILDINRAVLPSGIIESLSFRESEEDHGTVFTKLREQLRKSIAWHFELNARKAGLEDALIDYSDDSDYARQRSRFSIDIDKEGQFKMNVPASSEVGNVPLLVRQENFSNLKGAAEDEDRGQFLRNATDNTDIQLEPHGFGSVSLVSNEESLKSYAAPLSSITGEAIQLGTGFHYISNVLFAHKFEGIFSDSTGNGGYPNSPINSIPPVEDVVSPEVIVSGEGANAGGRSGTIALDGFLSISVGANTVDRQSLWVDTAGGIVAAVGRDKYNRSLSATFDGDVFMEIGGPTITDDSRFQPQTGFVNDARDGVVDIRVWRSGSFHIFRIDNSGIYVHSPANIDIVSEKNIRMKAFGNLTLDGDSVFVYSSSDGSVGRLVQRQTTGPAGKTI